MDAEAGELLEGVLGVAVGLLSEDVCVCEGVLDGEA